MNNLTRVRRYQRELEESEGRAEHAESSLNLIRAKHRSSVLTSSSSAKVRCICMIERMYGVQRGDTGVEQSYVYFDPVPPKHRHEHGDVRPKHLEPQRIPVLADTSMTSHLLNVQDYLYKVFES
jgi:hypothetical protein